MRLHAIQRILRLLMLPTVLLDAAAHGCALLEGAHVDAAAVEADTLPSVEFQSMILPCWIVSEESSLFLHGNCVAWHFLANFEAMVESEPAVEAQHVLLLQRLVHVLDFDRSKVLSRSLSTYFTEIHRTQIVIRCYGASSVYRRLVERVVVLHFLAGFERELPGGEGLDVDVTRFIDAAHGDPALACLAR